jgi:hypothetical protein
LGVVTTTLTAPAAWADVVAVIEVPLTTETPDADAPPNITDVAPKRFVPVMVTTVPPNVEPVTGEIPVTVGKTEEPPLEDPVEFFHCAMS